ncbi:MAG: beta-ketoacyl synthase N-terminal-like domain-containing protein, partial [Myxococcota bacterium]
MCWSEPLRATSELLSRRMACHSAGQFVLEWLGEVVAAMYSIRLPETGVLDTITWRDIEGCHDPRGPIAFLLAANVSSAHQARGIGDHLREYVLQVASLSEGIELAAGVTRCRDFTPGQVPLAQYIHERDSSGLHRDPILRWHARHGATITRLIPGYRPEDRQNQGAGVLIEYDLAARRGHADEDTHAGGAVPPGHDRVHATTASGGEMRAWSLSEITEQCRALVGAAIKSSAALDMNASWNDMGLDSLDLYGLRAALAECFSIGLSATTFFRHATPAGLAQYLAERLRSAGDGESVRRPAGRSQQHRAVDRSSLIAVVGAACHVPQASSVAELWQLLHRGQDGIGEIPARRREWFRDRLGDDVFTRDLVAAGGYLADIESFDARFFRVSPRDASRMDPQQRLLLRTSWEALEHAGINPQECGRSRTGVFIGSLADDYYPLSSDRVQSLQHATGASGSLLAGRLRRDIEGLIHRRGLHPGFACLHASQDHRGNLALDLMEPYRPALAEGLAVRLFNRRSITPEQMTRTEERQWRAGPETFRALVGGYEHAAKSAAE